MNVDFYIDRLKTLLNEKRFKHSIGVMDTAVKLAERYGADVEKARVAGLLHDCAKNLSSEELIALAEKYNIELDDVLRHSPFLLHGPVGGYLIRDNFGVCDEEIKRAVMLHTTGDKDMTLLDKIIFLADFIEPGRDFEGVDVLRKTADEDLDKAVIMALDRTIEFVIKNNQLLYNKTVIARNDMLIKLEKSNIN
ncbi:bis(5'-nucleosyl)-tetraphosphatase (symmetrical) YqeK [Thermoanaerobacterium sp. RBIITD]|uniref:bis(5'-nucleosyl)-tetraphosphatase (symmetrical) YqeK n=1 Tax=Thermoanaerobacterium sp. RBIITD TaxID=1550240 RepID=UPI000BB75755|nr:bis(5'-nucleosyl)-tetraphosphatase (symmetrical) YqeK [Thermoanaerobacterium sp. RBIITD]SNX55164.1 putative HD superfamily hydrolase of NAD metabolism [Thermoanaerobacterium sp. RBIITD]